VKPRLDGADATLEGLGVAEAAALATDYAEKRQALIERLIAEGRFKAFPDAVRFADGLHAAGLRLALASSSKNVASMVRRLSLPDGRPLPSIFDADLSGTDVPRGKPDPALFWLAARALKLPPARCVVVEDARPASPRRAPEVWPRSASRGLATQPCASRRGRPRRDQPRPGRYRRRPRRHIAHPA